MDVPNSQLVVPALALALFVGFGIVGNLGLDVAVLAPGGPGEPTDSPGQSAPDGAASGDVDATATEAMEQRKAANSDDGPHKSTDSSGSPSDGAGRGSYADGDADLSLLSPDSTLAATLRGPLYLLDDTDSPLAATLRATDETVTTGGEVVDDTVDNVGDTADGTTGETTDGVTDAVENTTDSTTDTLEDTTGSTTDTVDDTLDDTTSTPTPTPDGSPVDTIEDTLDTPTPTESDGGLL